jgi:hypothetical protein
MRRRHPHAKASLAKQILRPLRRGWRLVVRETAQIGRTTLSDSSTVRVLCEEGSTDCAIVSFTGIGFGLGTIQKQEFAATIRSAGHRHSIYYVIDKQRRWYNGIEDEVRETLSDVAARYRRVVTLGNSMGGFGAVYFAPDAGARRTLAFCPQFSLAPGSAPPGEDRWPEFRSRIDTWTVDHALQSRTDGIEYFLFFGTDGAIDRAHAELYRRHGGTSVHTFMIEACGHDVAAFLKKAGVLHLLMRDIFSDGFSHRSLGAVFDAHGIAYEHLTGAPALRPADAAIS